MDPTEHRTFRRAGLQRNPAEGADEWQGAEMDASRGLDLRFTYGEVVVLFELLHRWEDDGTLHELPFTDEAERVAVWNLSATLEPLVDEAFSSPDDYRAAVEEARASLRAE